MSTFDLNSHDLRPASWTSADAAGLPILPLLARYQEVRCRSALNRVVGMPFEWTLNPYRGCSHGCIYCFARPSHEFLGFSAGLDFETKIVVKAAAPELLEEAFRKKSWTPQPVAFSGNTDCYQPAERRLGLTRRCLEVCLRYRNPATVLTKNRLVLRDLDSVNGTFRMVAPDERLPVGTILRIGESTLRIDALS